MQGTYAPHSTESAYHDFSEDPAEEDESLEDASEDKARRIHDGFYLRMGTGFGYLIASRDLRTSGNIEAARQSLDGIAQLFEISFGGAVSPGLIIGGGVYGSHVFTTKQTISVTSNDPDIVAALSSEDVDIGSSTLALACPFVNVYFQPRSGFNALAGPCAAFLDFGESELHSGFGLNLGLGGEWFVSNTWSLGFLARFQYASVSYEDGNALSVVLPGVLFTATYN